MGGSFHSYVSFARGYFPIQITIRESPQRHGFELSIHYGLQQAPGLLWSIDGRVVESSCESPNISKSIHKFVLENANQFVDLWLNTPNQSNSCIRILAKTYKRGLWTKAYYSKVPTDIGSWNWMKLGILGIIFFGWKHWVCRTVWLSIGTMTWGGHTPADNRINRQTQIHKFCKSILASPSFDRIPQLLSNLLNGRVTIRFTGGQWTAVLYRSLSWDALRPPRGSDSSAMCIPRCRHGSPVGEAETGADMSRNCDKSATIALRNFSQKSWKKSEKHGNI